MPTAASLLARPYPAALALLLAVWLLLLPGALGRLRRRLAQAGPRIWLPLAALVLGALALRLALPSAHRVYYDEFEHMDIARRLAASGAFAQTLAGGLEGWDALARPTWPGGHHVALAAAYALAGAGEATAFAWSALLSALSALFVFWAALEAFDDEAGALAAAFVWSAAPLGLTWARAADLTSSSTFWIAATLAALHAREREPGRAPDAFAAATLAYAVQVRPENVLLAGYAALLRAPAVVLWPALAGFAAPALIAWSNRADALPGYSASTTAPLSHLSRQLLPNLRWLASTPSFLPLLRPAALAAATRRRAAALAFLAAGFLLLYAGFFRGRFDAGSEDRYALSALLPLAVAAGGALGPAAAPAALLAAGLAAAGPAAPDPAHAASLRFLKESAALLPARAYVAAFNPPFVREAAGRPAVWAYLLLEDAAAVDAARAAVGAAPELVLYKDWAWRSRAADAERLETALSVSHDARVLATDGRDSLVLLAPRARR